MPESFAGTMNSSISIFPPVCAAAGKIANRDISNAGRACSSLDMNRLPCGLALLAALANYYARHPKLWRGMLASLKPFGQNSAWPSPLCYPRTRVADLPARFTQSQQYLRHRKSSAPPYLRVVPTADFNAEYIHRSSVSRRAGAQPLRQRTSSPSVDDRLGHKLFH